MTAPRLGIEPVRLAPVDLAAAFAKPAPAGGAGTGPADRAAGLRGLALARPSTAPPAEPAAGRHHGDPQEHRIREALANDDPETDSAEFAEAEEASPDPDEVDDLSPQPIVVYVPVSLRDRLRAHHAASKETYTTIVLNAVEDAHDQLAELLEAHRPPARPGGLFRHQARPRVQHDEPHVQVSLRPARADLQVLDRLTTDHQAPSRSALLVVALDNYLPPRPSN